MARQGNWNRTFWQNFDKIGEIPIDEIRNVMLVECGKTESVLMANTPFRFGGLQSSVYSVVADTPKGVSARAGYTQTPHWDLDPTNPHQDSFTNPTLMSYLEAGTVDAETNAKIARIKVELEDFPIRVQEQVKNILNGGK